MDEKIPANKLKPGLELEKIVCRIQQMTDHNSTVTHNEFLLDRVGNKRQYDVVIRGKFGGRPILGVIECKDHKRKKGPSAIEAFSKKTENLGANLRIMVSKKGFTPQALNLAKHESIGCLSFLPHDPEQVGFSIGDMWYGIIKIWTNIQLAIHFNLEVAPISSFDSNFVLRDGKPVINWFLKELFTKYGEVKKEGEHSIELKFTETRNIEIDGKTYPVLGFTCSASRVYRKKKKWVNWSGDAFYDWHNSTLTIPAKGTVVGSPVETDLGQWEDYDGEIPDFKSNTVQSLASIVAIKTEKWDNNKDCDVPELMKL